MLNTNSEKYFYGDEAMLFSYFRIPRQLITHPRFKPLSSDAKLLYGMLLDRMGLSIKNELPHKGDIKRLHQALACKSPVRFEELYGQKRAQTL